MKTKRVYRMRYTTMETLSSVAQRQPLFPRLRVNVILLCLDRPESFIWYSISWYEYSYFSFTIFIDESAEIEIVNGTKWLWNRRKKSVMADQPISSSQGLCFKWNYSCFLNVYLLNSVYKLNLDLKVAGSLFSIT